MKLVILGLIFSSICFTGFKFSNSFKEKERFYYEFCSFLLFLKGEISFLKSNILEILEKFNSKNENLNKVIINYKNYLKTEEYVFISLLSNEENLQIKHFFERLGQNDCFNQNEYIETNLAVFQKKYEDAKNANLKYGAMYKKLSIILAIFICIILI